MSKWQQFLNEVFEGDQARIELLRGWFNHLLTNEGGKMVVLLSGVPRSGKGTIGHVIHRLLGDKSAMMSSTEASSKRGQKVLKDKAVVVIGDIIFNKKIPMVITGPVCNVTLISNSEPDSVNGQLLVIKFNKSFLGSEKLYILLELTLELEDIRKWALN